MGFDIDDEILQDFLVEAGEILEQLQEQLVELENNPTDSDLLNAIFRGFHTVKGGAGFLSLTHLVDACHGAENVFDMLRNGQLEMTSELMDVILQALDTVNEMFVLVQAGDELEPADPQLLATLEAITDPNSPSPLSAPEPTAASAPAPVAEPVPEPSVKPEPVSLNGGGIDSMTQPEFEHIMSGLDDSQSGAPLATAAESRKSAPADIGSGDEISDDEFEALLDNLHGKGQFSTEVAPEPIAPSGDLISDDEFENLLDELHGKGGAPGKAPAAAEAPASDEITDDEFEALLDQLHGKGQAPAAVTPEPAAVEAVVAAPVAAVKAATEPAKAAPKKAPAKAQSAPTGETTVRVDTARLDDIMNMVGELVLVRNRLVSLGIEREDEEMSKAVANLDLVTADLQGAVMKTRMQPIKKVFGRFPRVVRDLARSLNKDIALTMEGEDTDLDKNLVEALSDPLVHLVRNAVDHGIEMPDEREANGKPRQGNILLSASQEGDHILLCIRDDGAGMDAEKLKGIAISRGILDEDGAARMSDQDAYNLIFAPGFSTKTEISDISGRGVGMDVVKTRITQLNGSVHIDSNKGTGTILEIKVPLTLAIMPTLMVEVGEQIFALPLSCINEIFHLDLSKTNVVDGQLTVTVREKAIPLFYLDKWLLNGPGRVEREDQGHVVIVHIGTLQVGFVVDGLIGQEEVVIKPLGSLLHGTPGMAGATITSDGGCALILDVPGLLKQHARR
ncbi:two-component system, chemotaxis family, sensor kinase CheA [Ferrimonas sediminum]|uniref:Chemotaxis protein CheA n=1 Tax=Ferrimonas sediminum TaxID=718193 RepID=A0A1G8YYH9_9GAMM|nr:chemotaxis protein CheA [Ferrimonas sediminum]SDK07464.1 two-component system, chemotaxis family, sensor kinase CheA [Ferrimonas sediminum]